MTTAAAPLLIIGRCSVPSRSFLLGPSALRGLHLDRPCAPATIAVTSRPRHNEHHTTTTAKPSKRVSTKRGEPQGLGKVVTLGVSQGDTRVMV